MLGTFVSAEIFPIRSRRDKENKIKVLTRFIYQSFNNSKIKK